MASAKTPTATTTKFASPSPVANWTKPECCSTSSCSKNVLRPVVDRIDHQMLNDLEPFTELNPSAENLARYFYDQTNTQLAEMTGGRVRVKDCTIWETDTTTATYYE